MGLDLGFAQRRVIGCLIEKRWTTPEEYPLTLRSLLAACNQRSNRDPIVAFEEFEVLGTVRGLIARRLVFQRDVEGGRVPHFGERLSEELGLDRPAQAILAELLLRGPQTAPELARRAARMAEFSGPEEAESILEALAARGLVRRLERRSGERRARWMHLFGADEEGGEAEGSREDSPPAAPPAPGSDAAEIDRLRRELDALRARLDALEERLSRLEGTA